MWIFLLGRNSYIRYGVDPLSPRISVSYGDFLLHKLPLKQPNQELNACFICRVSGTVKHLLFYYVFAKEICNLFGFVIKGDTSVFWRNRALINLKVVNPRN